MKNIFILIIFSALSIVRGYTQDIPEKANTVIVSVSDSATVKSRIVTLLESKGYSVVYVKSPMVITTAPRTLKNGTRVTYKFEIKGGEVFITGYLPVAGQSGTLISYQGNKGTPMMNGWDEMTKLAKELKGPIKFERK